MSERHPTERPNSHEQGLVSGLVNAASGSCAISRMIVGKLLLYIDMNFAAVS